MVHIESIDSISVMIFMACTLWFIIGLLIGYNLGKNSS